VTVRGALAAASAWVDEDGWTLREPELAETLASSWGELGTLELRALLVRAAARAREERGVEVEPSICARLRMVAEQLLAIAGELEAAR
jgi:hypothetical protein